MILGIAIVCDRVECGEGTEPPSEVLKALENEWSAGGVDALEVVWVLEGASVLAAKMP